MESNIFSSRKCNPFNAGSRRFPIPFSILVGPYFENLADMAFRRALANTIPWNLYFLSLINYDKTHLMLYNSLVTRLIVVTFSFCHSLVVDTEWANTVQAPSIIFHSLIVGTMLLSIWFSLANSSIYF